jgi:hypothetical protein
MIPGIPMTGRTAAAMRDAMPTIMSKILIATIVFTFQ